MSMFDLHVNSTSNLLQIRTNSKSRFGLESVTRAENIKHKKEAGISVTSRNKFSCYIDSTSKRDRNYIEITLKKDVSSIIWS